MQLNTNALLKYIYVLVTIYTLCRCIKRVIWRLQRIYALQENQSFNIELSDTLESDIVFTSDVYGYIDADYVITVKEVYVYLKSTLKNFVDFS